MRGKLIVIDGADAAGKKTQSKLLVDKLNESNVLGENKARYITFPNYESPWGRIIKEVYLSGELGNLEDIDPLASAMLFVADRATEAQKIRNALNGGDWLIVDRYVQSNFTYQGIRIEDMEKRDWFINTLQAIEYQYIGLPRPDKVLILELSNEVRFQRSFERGYEDIHEKNHDFMVAVADEYRRLADKFGWQIIDCSPEGEQLSIGDISEKIWNFLFHGKEDMFFHGTE